MLSRPLEDLKGFTVTNSTPRNESGQTRDSHLILWKTRLIEWIETHPIQAITIITTICTAVGVGILQEIANRIIDTEIAPWLGVTASVYRWIVFGVVLVLG